MLLNDKKLKSLVKKTQKKCEERAKLRENKKLKLNPPPVIEEEQASEIFDEMKKLPFTE